MATFLSQGFKLTVYTLKNTTVILMSNRTDTVQCTYKATVIVSTRSKESENRDCEKYCIRNENMKKGNYSKMDTLMLSI